ncbi:MAG TPA: hypothetical protein VNS58_28480 [Puia sp.]|nr:hypothetical protein [Puia sp.]
MIDYPNLIPECNVDTVFVEMLGYKNPNHAPSISQVSAILEKKKANQKAIGFVDGDKKMPKYFDQFEVLDKINNVRLLKHPNKDQYLVVVQPAMDKFIFSLCNSLGINLADYHFPRELKAFIGFTKKQSIKNDSNFKNLLNTISQKKCLEVAKIRSWITKYS